MRIKKCKGVSIYDCFSCELPDCTRAESSKKKMIGELSGDIYLPIEYINETRKMERDAYEQTNLLRFAGK